MADTESLGEAGVAWLEGLAAAPPSAAPRAHPHHHRSARARFRLLQAPEADRRHGRHRGARDPRLRGAGRADDQHLHQLPDHPAAGARRAPGAGRHRRRHLLQQRDGRAQQLRGRALGAGRRAHRPHAALRLPSRCAPRRHHAFRGRATSPRTSPTGARSAASSAAPPTATGRCRSSRGSRRVPNSDELKHFGAALASFGSVAMFHMPGVTPEAPTLADAFHGRAAPAGNARSARPTSRLSMPATRRPATRSTWSCSPRRSCR